jgi:ribosomal protein S17E
MKKKQDPSDEQMKYLKKVSEDLESMILGSDLPTVQNINKHDLPALSTVKPLNYEVVKFEADTKAEEVVESVVLLYLPKEFVFEHDYVNQKMSIDKLTVSNLIFQMKTAEHAIIRLLEEVDAGGVRDRTFEVLSSLQKSKMEIVKHLAQFMIILENNYKNLKLDYESNTATNTHVNDIEAEELRQESSRFRGTKTLMSTIQGYINDASKNIKNDDFEDISENENPT